MSGTFDAENLQFAYDNCVKTSYVYKEDGDVDTMEEIYTDGTGVIKFTEGEPLSLTWQDDKENIAAGMVFEYYSPADAQ